VSRLAIYARSLTANWVGFLANLVVAFMLAPFVLRSLGESAYGVWILLVELTGYLGLIEMGTQAGLGRHINYYLGRGEIDRVNGFVNTALLFFLAAGAAILLLAGGLALALDSVFTKIPSELVASARPALLLVAVNLILALLGAVFPLILNAFDRFDLSNAVNLVVLAVRTVGTILVLKQDGGLVELAGVQVVSSVIGAGAGMLLARRVFPSLRLDLRLWSRERFRELFGFGIWAFVGQIGMQFLYWSSTILITVLLGPAMVVFFSMPMMLIQYGRGVVDNMAGVLGPQTIKASSVGDHVELRRIFSWGSKVIMFVAIPLFGGLMVYGGEFLILWLGPHFARSAAVLLLLAVPQWVVWSIRPGVNVILGLGHVRFAGLMTLGQGVLNVAATLFYVLVLKMGLLGVAWGLLVPMIAFNSVIAWFVLRWIDMPPRQFLVRNVGRYAVTAAAFLALAWGVSYVGRREVWAWFFAKVIFLVLAAAPLGWYGVFSRDERCELGQRIRDMLRRKRREIPQGPDGVETSEASQPPPPPPQDEGEPG